MRVSTCGLMLMLAALLTVSCGAQNSGSCQLPGTPPRLAGTPVPPQAIPAGAATTKAATVVVTAVVDSHGAVTSAAVTQSSQNATIDEAALALVRASEFDAGTPGCGTSIPDSTTVSVTFYPNP